MNEKFVDDEIEIRRLSESFNYDHFNLSYCLEDGVIIPASYYKSKCQHHTAPIAIICCHGLGFDPIKANHFNDIWTKFLLHVSFMNNLDGITYTARGHGNSTGWEQQDISQFSWGNLSNDLMAISKQNNLSKFFVGGHSMGASTALYAAINDSSRLYGIILIKLPTAWETRRLRKDKLQLMSQKLQLLYPNGNYFKVLLGASETDLPSITNEVDQYHKIQCPVLILAYEGDPTHPVSTAEAIAAVLPQSELHIANNHEEAMERWPDIISNFIHQNSPKI